MGKTSLPPEHIHELLRYDPESGRLYWRIGIKSYGGGRSAGDPAGTDKDGYISICLNGVKYRAHRLVWYMVTGDWPPSKQDIDHINGNRSDNRFSNLRLTSRSQNNMNLPLRADNISGYRGVTWRRDTKKWHARITVNRKITILGDFIDLEDARSARAKAEELYFGAHSYLNRPEAVVATANTEN